MYRSGLVCKVSPHLYISTQRLITVLARCTAPSNDLDSQRHLRRSREHTEMLSGEFELGILWDEYGIVGNIIVSLFITVNDIYLLTSTFCR